MKRYFYTDPLAASWMAKHFGMRLTVRNGVYEPNWQELASSGNADGYFVHPDCLHLFEPQRDDIWAVQSCRNDGKWYVGVLDEIGEDVCVGGMIIRQKNVVRRKIIQREGKPFFWPESDG